VKMGRRSQRGVSKATGQDVGGWGTRNIDIVNWGGSPTKVKKKRKTKGPHPRGTMGNPRVRG